MPRAISLSAVQSDHGRLADKDQREDAESHASMRLGLFAFFAHRRVGYDTSFPRLILPRLRFDRQRPPEFPVILRIDTWRANVIVGTAWRWMRRASRVKCDWPTRARQRTLAAGWAAVVLLAALCVPAGATVVWSSGCDSTDGWSADDDSLAWPALVTSAPIHSAPCAWGYTSRRNRVWQTFPVTSGTTALRFWLYDADLSYSGEAPVADIRAGSGSLGNIISAGVMTLAPGGATHYACRIVDGGTANPYVGTVPRSVGWHRLEVLYSDSLANHVGFYVDGELSCATEVNSAFAFGAASVGRGTSPAAVSGNFRCDTMAVLSAPRLLTFTAANGTVAVSVGGVAFAQRNGLYDQSETLSLSATPNPGSSFVSWTSTAGGVFGSDHSATTTFTGATGNGTITANFACGAESVASIGDLWPLSNGPSYDLTDKVVTGVVGNAFWIEEADRYAAIKVIWNGTMPAQDHSVNVTGVLDSSSGQRVLNASSVTDNGAATAIKPLGVVEKSAGGAEINTDTPSISNGKGLYSIGMLVRIAGSAGNSNTADPEQHVLLSRRWKRTCGRRYSWNQGAVREGDSSVVRHQDSDGSGWRDRR